MSSNKSIPTKIVYQSSQFKGARSAAKAKRAPFAAISQNVTQTPVQSSSKSTTSQDLQPTAPNSSSVIVEKVQIDEACNQIEAIRENVESLDLEGMVIQLSEALEDQILKNDRQKEQLQAKDEQLKLLKAQLSSFFAERMQLRNQVASLNGDDVQVLVRLRPATCEVDREKNLCVVKFGDDGKSLEIAMDEIDKVFTADRIFQENATQDEVFEKIQPIVLSALDGYNACIFAYGETGSGKSLTMSGDLDSHGVIQQSFDLLFKTLGEVKQFGLNYKIFASFFEVHKENVYDLLGDCVYDPVEVNLPDFESLESLSNVANLVSREVDTPEALHEMWQESKLARWKLFIEDNQIPSQSHQVTRIVIKSEHECARKVGTIHLIETPGSEKRDLSRIALRNSTVALAQKCEFAVFFDSSLTRLLAPWCYGDRSMTAMIVNLSPLFAEDLDESVKNLKLATNLTCLKLGEDVESAE